MTIFFRMLRSSTFNQAARAKNISVVHLGEFGLMQIIYECFGLSCDMTNRQRFCNNATYLHTCILYTKCIKELMVFSIKIIIVIKLPSVYVMTDKFSHILNIFIISIQIYNL